MTVARDSTPLFPVFLKLHGRRVVVVGAGPVAASKLDGLLAAGAVVDVIAPEVSTAMERLAETNANVSIHRRAFAPADLDGAWFVVAAAPPEVNREVGLAAEERALFVNAVDDKASATAYLGGVVRRGGVTLAISTDGAAPALAGLLREALEAVLPNELQRWSDVARQAREEWMRASLPMERRRPFLLRALNALYEGRDSSPKASSTETTAPQAPSPESSATGDTESPPARESEEVRK